MSSARRKQRGESNESGEAEDSETRRAMQVFLT